MLKLYNMGERGYEKFLLLTKKLHCIVYVSKCQKKKKMIWEKSKADRTLSNLVVQLGWVVGNVGQCMAMLYNISWLEGLVGESQ